MSPRPLIFISAVSKELKSARLLVSNTLQFLGYEPVWQDIFGTEQGDLREMLRNLAYALWYQGKYAVAKVEYRDVINISTTVLGPEHPQTLWTRRGLANVLREQGQYAQAETEYREVVKVEDNGLGKEHPETLQTSYNLALCLMAENKPDEAKEFAHRAANGAKINLGRNHPDTVKYEKFWQDLQTTNSAPQPK